MLAKNSTPITLPINLLLKADTPFEGERLVRMQVSSQEKDSENDVILQKALLASANYYVSYGNVDLDHMTLVGYKLQLPHVPQWYELGNPLEVVDLGNYKTEILWQCKRNPRGFDPENNVYDFFWQSLFLDPPTKWRASIAGPIHEVDDKVEGHRYVVEKMQWINTAVTKVPVNYNIEGIARPVITKSLAIVNEEEDENAQEEMPVTQTTLKAVNDVYELIAQIPPSLENASVAHLTEHFGQIYKAEHGLARIYALAAIKHLQMFRQIS